MLREVYRLGQVVSYTRIFACEHWLNAHNRLTEPWNLDNKLATVIDRVAILVLPPLVFELGFLEVDEDYIFTGLYNELERGVNPVSEQLLSGGE